ncbi:transporter, partial [Streptomyces nigrescens]
MSTESAAVAAGPAAAPSLTAVFVRLKLTLLRNGLRQSTGRTLAYVSSVIVGLLFASGVVVGLIALRGNPHVGALVVLLTGILTLGWA